MAPETYTNPAGFTCQIAARHAGRHFATVGQVLSLDGEILAETPEVPYGFLAAAKECARALADEMKEYA